MTKLTIEESLLLLACRPSLEEKEQKHLASLAKNVSDWPLVLWRAENYRIMPLLHDWLSKTSSLGAAPSYVGNYMESWSALSLSRSKAQFQQLGRIVRSLEDESIDYFLLKGSGLAALYYPDPSLRPMQDLDFIVRPEDASRVQQILFQLGYRHGIWDSDSETFTPTEVRLTPYSLQSGIEIPPFTYLVRMQSPVAEKLVLPEWRRQHLKCAVKDQQLVMPVFLDVHINLSEGIDLPDVWRGARTASVFGVPTRVQSATMMLWFIATRLYYEAFAYNTLKLSMFGDVHTLLTQAQKEIDWPELLALAHKYGTRPALYYVLAQMRTLTGVEVPLNVLSVLMPRASEIPLENDWGDVIPKLLSRPALHEFTYAT